MYQYRYSRPRYPSTSCQVLQYLLSACFAHRCVCKFQEYLPLDLNLDWKLKVDSELELELHRRRDTDLKLDKELDLESARCSGLALSLEHALCLCLNRHVSGFPPFPTLSRSRSWLPALDHHPYLCALPVLSSCSHDRGGAWFLC